MGFVVFFLVLECFAVLCITCLCLMTLSDEVVEYRIRPLQNMAWCWFHCSPDIVTALFITVFVSINAAVAFPFIICAVWKGFHASFRFVQQLLCRLWNRVNCFISRHEWVWWCRFIDRCEEEQVCRHCGCVGLNRRINHQTFWQYETGDGCEQVQMCRCREVRDLSNPRRTVHHMGKWMCASDKQHVRVCARSANHMEFEAHSLVEKVEQTAVVVPGGGKCIDPHWGLCAHARTVTTKEFLVCESCGYVVWIRQFEEFEEN
jgi:hypothetical protein